MTEQIPHCDSIADTLSAMSIADLGQARAELQQRRDAVLDDNNACEKIDCAIDLVNQLGRVKRGSFDLNTAAMLAADFAKGADYIRQSGLKNTKVASLALQLQERIAAASNESLQKTADLRRETHNQVLETSDITTRILTDDECRLLYNMTRSDSEFNYQIRVRQIAKKKGIPAERLRTELRRYVTKQIRNTEKGPLRHFHRTSFDVLRTIARSGQFLSRSEIKRRYPDINLKGWSASDDVMFTRDQYDGQGRLINPGLRTKEVVGASGNGVIFVMRDSMMDLEQYDAVRMYPTISGTDIAPHCECLLVATAEDIATARQIIANTPLATIPVRLRSDWERENGREEL